MASGEINTLFLSIPARYFNTFINTDEHAPIKFVVLPVIIVPSSNSIAPEKERDSSSFLRAAITHGRSSSVIPALFITTSCF